ncbi:hypothetical protein DFJ73DRAFT_945558 [Zopfochytrium polystomum]|nr:hypothetical protein DFJ73DRAFT_945558 [Zopfochytrium polystomum]
MDFRPSLEVETAPVRSSTDSTHPKLTRSTSKGYRFADAFSRAARRSPSTSSSMTAASNGNNNSNSNNNNNNSTNNSFRPTTAASFSVADSYYNERYSADAVRTTGGSAGGGGGGDYFGIGPVGAAGTHQAAVSLDMPSGAFAYVNSGAAYGRWAASPSSTTPPQSRPGAGDDADYEFSYAARREREGSIASGRGGHGSGGGGGGRGGGGGGGILRGLENLKESFKSPRFVQSFFRNGGGKDLGRGNRPPSLRTRPSVSSIRTLNSPAPGELLYPTMDTVPPSLASASSSQPSSTSTTPLSATTLNHHHQQKYHYHQFSSPDAAAIPPTPPYALGVRKMSFGASATSPATDLPPSSPTPFVVSRTSESNDDGLLPLKAFTSTAQFHHRKNSFRDMPQSVGSLARSNSMSTNEPTTVPAEAGATPAPPSDPLSTRTKIALTKRTTQASGCGTALTHLWLFLALLPTLPRSRRASPLQDLVRELRRPTRPFRAGSIPPLPTITTRPASEDSKLSTPRRYPPSPHLRAKSVAATPASSSALAIASYPSPEISPAMINSSVSATAIPGHQYILAAAAAAASAENGPTAAPGTTLPLPPHDAKPQ